MDITEINNIISIRKYLDRIQLDLNNDKKTTYSLYADESLETKIDNLELQIWSNYSNGSKFRASIALLYPFPTKIRIFALDVVPDYVKEPTCTGNDLMGDHKHRFHEHSQDNYRFHINLSAFNLFHEFVLEFFDEANIELLNNRNYYSTQPLIEAGRIIGGGNDGLQ
jgi:hypothetical protein